MDGIITTPARPDTRKLKRWLKDQIYEMEAEKSAAGFNVHRAGQLAFARRVLERLTHQTK